MQLDIILREKKEFISAMQLHNELNVKKHFAGICKGDVDRYELPNIRALNFMLHNTLGGGGTVSLKHDAQGKTLAAALLRMELDI